MTGEGFEERLCVCRFLHTQGLYCLITSRIDVAEAR